LLGFVITAKVLIEIFEEAWIRKLLKEKKSHDKLRKILSAQKCPQKVL